MALVAAPTLAPALIGLFAKRIKAPSAPVPDDGFFAGLARWVQRRSLHLTLVVTGLLLICGLPFLRVNFQNGGADLLPTSFESRQFLDLQRSRFPDRGVEPITIVARADLSEAGACADTLRAMAGVADVRARNARRPGDGGRDSGGTHQGTVARTSWANFAWTGPNSRSG